MFQYQGRPRKEDLTMTPDPVLLRLAQLPAAEPGTQVTAHLREAAHLRLRARPVHPVWIGVIMLSAVCYLAWAAQFSSKLFVGP
jgi:hypothetical protein